MVERATELRTMKRIWLVFTLAAMVEVLQRSTKVDGTFQWDVFQLDGVS